MQCKSTRNQNKTAGICLYNENENSSKKSQSKNLCVNKHWKTKRWSESSILWIWWVKASSELLKMQKKKRERKRERRNNTHNVIYLKYDDYYVYRNIPITVKHAILFFKAKIWTSNWKLCACKHGHFLSYFQSIISVICIKLRVCCHYSLRPGIWCVGGVKTLKDLENHSTITKVWSRCCDVGR